jgi:hypothetical protein
MLPSVIDALTVSPRKREFSTMRERARYIGILQRRVDQGLLSASEMVEAITAYDSSRAKTRNASYALISILMAAVAAIASAIAVFFAAVSVWRP